MRLIDGFWWPESDRHAHEAMLVEDVDRAVTLVKEKTVCVQAGGCVGVWAAHLADTFEEVWTVEPDWENYLCLVRNVPVNVRTFWAALGQHPGNVDLDREPGNSGAHHVTGPGRIPAITIDEFDLPACDLIVLDIEGMERLALAGAWRTLERFKPVLMIEDKGLSRRYGYDQGWTASLEGYRVERTVHRDVILVPE